MSKSFIHKLSKDTLLYLPAKVIPGLLGFITLIIYTRFLTPEQYGRFSLVFGAFAFVVTLSFSWLEQSILRFFDEHTQKNRDEFFSTIFLLVVSYISVLSIFSFVILNYIMDITPELLILINIAIVLYPINALYKIILQILRSDRKASLYSVFSSFFIIIYVILIYCMLRFLGFKEEGLMIGYLIAYFLLLISQLIILRKDYSFNFRFNLFSKDYMLEYIKYGSPWLGVAVGTFLLSKVDRYLIEYYLTTDLVGIYSMTYSLAEKSIMQFASLLTISTLPVLIKDFNEDDDNSLTKMMEELLKIYGILFIPAAFGLAFLSEEILLVFLGEEFYVTNSIFILISFAAVFEAVRIVFGRPFMLKKKTYFFPVLYLSSGMINIILNIILIPRIGINGAAIATIIGYFGYVLIAYLRSRSFFTWEIPWYTFLKCIFASIIMVTILYFNPIKFPNDLLYIISSIFLGVFSYFISLVVLKEKIILSGLNAIKKNYL